MGLRCLLRRLTNAGDQQRVYKSSTSTRIIWLRLGRFVFFVAFPYCEIRSVPSAFDSCRTALLGTDSESQWK